MNCNEIAQHLRGIPYKASRPRTFSNLRRATALSDQKCRSLTSLIEINHDFFVRLPFLPSRSRP
ncbi:protein of unknown function (plasmid) [Cupriavidus taiwanensis]|nr:protein of unknown function [Cupriavidus taiwanensis]SPA57213.1 protein of unknown function [Cupriavidus taiwanensis]